jgi:phosphonate transport system substrate-binding protein
VSPLRSVMSWLSLALVLGGAGCPTLPMREVVVRLDAGTVGTSSGTSRSAKDALRFSVAAIQSPTGTYLGYSRLLEHLGRELGRDIELVQRLSYRETNALLLTGQTDVAFVCTGGYLSLEHESPGVVEVLVVPVIRGETTYQSLTIVPAGSPVRRIAELAGRRVAFTDELSFTGRLYLVFNVRASGLQPERFFSSAIFTQSHDRSIEAVARGFVDAAAVDSNIFYRLTEDLPALASQVRVLDVSPPFGVPPVVALKSLRADHRTRLTEAFLSLDGDPEGAGLLKALGIDRFVRPPAHLYDSAALVLGGLGR